MKERPILFSGPMVRAILEGRKTQTRRIIKLRPGEQVDNNEVWDSTDPYKIKPCPYGIAGDVLWVRETFADLRGMGFDDDFAYREKSLKDYGDGCGMVEIGDSKRCRLDYGVKWKPSIFMPRDACRLRLRITDIRVERLQDISESDAKAEGVETQSSTTFGDTVYKNYEKGQLGWLTSAVGSFSTLWQSINGNQSWADNPWVWVIEFERITNA